MYLIDSNIIIYSANANFNYLRSIIKNEDSFVSQITKLEVLGFSKLDDKSKRYFESVFFSLNVISIEDEIVENAIILRQQKRLSLGDSIIASTALKYNFKLLTRNISDFEWIEGIELENPIF